MAEANTTVFVGNLSWNTTDEELRGFMLAAGEVVSSTIQRHVDTLRSKGWGLVKFKTEQEALKSIEMLNGIMLDTRNVHIRMDRSQIESSNHFAIFVGNLPWSTNDEDLATIFAEFKPIDSHVKTNMIGRSRGFGVIRFATPDQGLQAIAAMDGFEIDGRHIQVREDRDIGEGVKARTGTRRTRERGRPNDTIEAIESRSVPILPPLPPKKDRENCCTVFVGNLSWNTSDADLSEHFSTNDGMVSATVQVASTGRSKGWGLVTFSSQDEAVAAVSKMALSTLRDRRLTVRLDRK